MKFKTLIFSALGAGMILASCGGPGDGKSVEDMKNPTTVDSLSNLLGQLYAADYWNNAGADSTARTEDARKEYLNGVRAALSKAGKDKNYIEGYMLGLQFSLYADEFEKEMGVKIDMKKLMDGLAYGLRNDSAVNIMKVNEDFQRINTRIGMQKDAQDKKKADASMAAFLKGKSYIDMGHSLYGKIVRQGEGELIKIGDVVECNISITDAKGKKIGIPVPKDLSLNKHLADLPVGLALQNLKKGGAGEFVTTAHAMFGSRASEYGLDSSQPLVITIEVNGVTASSADKDNATGIQGKVNEVSPAEAPAPAK